MTEYRVGFMKWDVGIDVYISIEPEDRAEAEEDAKGSWRIYEGYLIGRAAEKLCMVLGRDSFIPDNWDWEVEEL